ncbi:hypothetical protein FQ330_03115 [Agrococcus sediminis]|uniref:Uncharacterized protein n=1 Tax=Agrococcus sediminis TaxID=2599924 RepID=A0A5M8QK44_9MICO|nr:hypothetical protein [Agrococcus sediminis]KAA6436409.1 hypothetical protein FQ330_03115 [Agrococcus sediminis]
MPKQLTHDHEAKKRQLRPLMKQVKALYKEWSKTTNLVGDDDHVVPPSNNYPPFTRKDGTTGTRLHIGFATARPHVEMDSVRAFAQWLEEHPEFSAVVIQREFDEECKVDHRFLKFDLTHDPAADEPDSRVAAAADVASDEDDRRAAPLYGSYPTLSHKLPAPTSFLRR